MLHKCCFIDAAHMLYHCYCYTHYAARMLLLHYCCCTAAALMLYTCYSATPLLHSRSDHGSCGSNSPPRVWNPPRIPIAQTEAEPKLTRASRTNADHQPVRDSAHRDHHPDQATPTSQLWAQIYAALLVLMYTCCCTDAAHILLH